MTLSNGKHVMLSYQWNSQNIISKVYDILKADNIPVWFDIAGGMKDDIYKSMAEGVENAAIVCCFMSPEYQESVNCQLELKYAQTKRKVILPCIITDQKGWKPSAWLGLITAGTLYIEFKDDSEEHIQLKTNELIDRIKGQPSVPMLPVEPTYLMELVKYEYIQEKNARIERIMNEAKSYPIGQSYINLAIVKATEQNEKEKQLRDAQHSNAIMSSFEEIYGAKTTIEVKDIFETYKSQEKQVLVFGRAGIGKSTFCRYVAYQWATGSYWTEYKLLALIPLRRLTEHRYPSNKEYSLIDLLKKEVFQYDLSEKDDKFLKKQFDANKILWILDGYDEIVQNVPPYLEDLLDQLLKTPHHIVTSRPYLNTLPYKVQMEITGFTDDNIEKYIEQFFDQLRDEIDDVSIKSQKLLNFLKSNSSIWGVAHIPVNLELICSLWSNQDWSESEQLTITTLYSMITEWLCRRYLASSNKHQISILSKNKIIQRCEKELSFLEILAFNAMASNTIIIRPSLLDKAVDEAKINLEENPRILNIGILKSFHKQGTGISIEMSKDHYFVHLSFQEYFTARYLVNALKNSPAGKAIEFIKYEKYNQRYALVFTFMSGLLSEGAAKSSLDIFWDNILGQPVDLVGIRHMQLVISCLEETSGKSTLSQRPLLLKWIGKCVRYSFSEESKIVYNHLLQSLQRAQSVACDQTIMNILIDLLQCNDTDIKEKVLSFVVKLNMTNPPIALINRLTLTIDDGNSNVRAWTCKALAEMDGKVVTDEVISKLLSALGDKSYFVRGSACYAFSKIAGKAETNEVINKLVSVLGDESEYVRWSASEALSKIAGKAATNDVINKLMSVLEDESEDFRVYACDALGKMGDKVATNDVIDKVISVVEDENEYVRGHACAALGKIGERVMTNEVINKLVSALGDESEYVRWSSCNALVNIGEKAATNEVINKLVSVLGDESEYVRRSARDALDRIGEKSGANVLGGEIKNVRESACDVPGRIDEVINKLVNALGDESKDVRVSACEALGRIGEKAATNEVINRLMFVANSDIHYISREAANAIGNIINSSFVITQLDPKIIANLCVCNRRLTALKNVSADQLIDVFITIKDSSVLSAVNLWALMNGDGVVAVEDKVVVYGSREPLELLVADSKVRQQLVEAFMDQAKQLHLSLEMPSIVLVNKPKVSSSSFPCSCNIL